MGAGWRGVGGGGDVSGGGDSAGGASAGVAGVCVVVRWELVVVVGGVV